MTELEKLLIDAGINIDIKFNTDKPVRNGSQWFVGKRFNFDDDHEIIMAWAGDYAKDKKVEYKSELNGLGENKDALKQVNDQVRIALQQEREERERVWLELAPVKEREFEDFSDRAPAPPYLRRKQIDQLYGARVAPNENGDPILVVPMRDVDGKFWNYQRIYSQKLSKGDKFFEKGCRIEGTFFTFGTISDKSETIYVTEGFATGASVYMALASEHVVVSCFNAGNLLSVTQALKTKYPRISIVLCADNDAYTVINNKPYNVGLEKARRAAGNVDGSVRYPIFKHPAKGFTDFNDLHCVQGLESVADQILHAKVSTALEPMLLKTTDKGGFKKPGEKEVTDYLLKFFNGRIVRQEKSLFEYIGTHWRECSLTRIDQIKQMIGIAACHTLGIRDINLVYQYFFTHCPSVPEGINFFQPNPLAANFFDGTLHLIFDGAKYNVHFAPHSREDYLTNVLPYNYPKDLAARADRFDHMLDGLWSTNADKKEVIKFVQELMGATLCPAFPIIALFQGKPNSGKSTIIKLLVRLMHEENVCSVQLSDMQGFNMESMVGKLLNFDTDIDTNRPMNDSEVKKIIDRVPRRVRRKGIADVYAYVPAVHLFASNQLPKSLDGSSHAYGRRLVVVRTESFNADTMESERDFETKLLSEEIEGILAFAVRGLMRLGENGGTFSIPESSKAMVREFEDESDLVGTFLDDVKHAEIQDGQSRLVFEAESKIERTKLWEIFNRWQGETSPNKVSVLGRNTFFTRLEARGYAVSRDQSGRYFVGFALKTYKGSVG